MSHRDLCLRHAPQDIDLPGAKYPERDAVLGLWDEHVYDADRGPGCRQHPGVGRALVNGSTGRRDYLELLDLTGVPVWMLLNDVGCWRSQCRVGGEP